MKWLSSDSYGVPTLLALGLHGVIIIAGLIAVDFSDDKIQEPKRPIIVNATVVDISQTIIGRRESEERAANQQQAALAEKKKRDAEQSKRKEAQRKALEDKQKKLAQAKRNEEKEAEALKREQAKKQQQAEQKRLSQEAEKKRIAQETEKKIQAQKAADDQKKKEQARKAEAERLAEEERKRQEEAARQAEQKKNAEAAAKAAAEAAELRAVEEAQMVQSISGLINSRVTAAWIRPPSARNNMKAQLRIYFLPNGEVMNVQITESSGDGLFDQRTVDAVYKVRRIEELADVDSYTFERNFREVDLIFNPQDLRN
ncbi:Tol-Pal system TolA [Marinomonas ushuaiensis DSM 15871]|uniref:Tol-Pal system TolA n=1 Tax=Marinomonas ushuaiensis DSM 15871 TaxID=1122207 RepID=X7E8K5_9GAMM|nr:cell envelope integrity protein TolA [Marinomonas ushuaiensis]ETX11526.1 Tol-Pal system TolA [Marinomonas ushuaiensis DSM 15871]